MKLYNIMYNVGKVKYLVNYHDGVQKHKDGSIFFGVRCFSNKKKFEEFKKELVKDGYVYGDCNFEITKENIHLHYSKMGNEDLIKNKVMLGFIFSSRFTILKNTLLNAKDELSWIYFNRTNCHGYIIEQSFFDVKDTLKPLDDYIVDIKNSDSYKSYISKQNIAA